MLLLILFNIINSRIHIYIYLTPHLNYYLNDVFDEIIQVMYLMKLL